MTENNELTTQQPKTEETKYTISEAYKPVKARYGLLDRYESYSLFSKIYKAFIKIKSNDYANELYANYTGDDIKNLDFDDIEIESFVGTCEEIYLDYKNDHLDIPDDFLDDDDVAEYLKNNLEDFWFDIKNGYFFYSNVVNAYYKTLDLSEVMEYFNIED